jgi:hypothetical protein
MSKLIDRINVFAPNLPHREDRKCNLLEQFYGKNEYNLKIVTPEKNEIASVSFWLTLVQIVQENVRKNSEYFIFCEDDILFTADYDFKQLKDIIELGLAIEADIILGAVSWFQTGLQLKNNLFWVEFFNGTQFSIIYRPLYQKILNCSFNNQDSADLKISELCDNKFVIHPFIAIQRDFGYSDVTITNNEAGKQDRLFSATSEMISILKRVDQFYSQ